MNDARYAGKPLLRLIELYVQHVIGALSEKDAALLDQMTPKLQQTFRRQGEWHAVIAGVMEFSGSLDSQLKSEWLRAQTAGLTAEDFSRVAADRLIS